MEDELGPPYEYTVGCCVSQQQTIAILLAAYNGEKYLEEQLQSLLDQSYTHFHLFIRDDGSTDGTLSILDRFAKRYPEKMTLLPSGESLGAKGNFSALMAYVSAHRYVMFCDQDDVWMGNKIALTFAKMKELEDEHGKMTPLLVHTDLKVADAELQVIDPSFWHYSRLSPGRSHYFNRLVVQNVVTGCTMMLNNPLLKLSLPMPSEAIMHDWWIALSASAFGKIGIVKTPTIYYRQHSKNTLGAQNFHSLRTIRKGISQLLREKIEVPQKYLQAERFLEHHRNRFDGQQRDMLEAFLLQPKNRWARKRYTMLKYRFFKNGFLRNLAQFLFGINF